MIDQAIEVVRKPGRPPGVIETRPRKARTAARATADRLAERLVRLHSQQITSSEIDRVMAAIKSDSYWLEILGKLEQMDDWRTVAELMKFWLQMRDGRPAQQINVTSTTVTFSGAEIARARAIARELGGRLDQRTPLTLMAREDQPADQKINRTIGQPQHNGLDGAGGEKGG
jgi:hypothetical protein